jgi:predicted secreted Zn-dependent protease
MEASMQSIMLFFFGALWILSSTVEANDSVSEDYKYYVINPNSKSEILKSLNSASPILDGGEIFHGYADSRIDWNFRWRYNKKRCWITSTSTKLKTTYTLPKLKTQSNDVYDIWNKWYPKLVLHEKGHHKLAVKIAVKIKNAINGMPHEKTCELLERKANAIGHAFISELDDLNENYDTSTNHGETQGAFLFEYL